MIGIFSNILLFFCFSFFILFLYSLTKQRNSLASLFACVCLAVSVYIGGYAMELRADNLLEITFALKTEYFGAPFMSAFWLLMSYKYLFRKSASMNLTLLIMSVPFITLFLSVTNETHHLIYTGISTFVYKGNLLALLEKGSWYFVNIAYAYFVQLFSMVVFFRSWRTKGFQFRTQAFWLFLGSIWPGIVNLIYIAGFSPLNLDLTPFGLSISGFCFCVALFRYGLLELQEIVRDVAFSEIGVGILVVDDRNRLIDFNQASGEIFSWLDVRHIGVDIGIFPEGKKILAQSAQHFELNIIKDREEKWYELEKTLILEKKRLGFVYFIHDISKQKELVSTLHDIASCDPLTEIYNRRRLMEETEKELQRTKRYGKCLSVLMIDIDHFKLVNDQFGHQAGDEVLKVLAASCRERLRRTDIIGRYGGEEFLAVLPETNEEQALLVAESIRKTIAELDFESNGSMIKITVSIGVKTVYSYEGNLSADSIINGADRALYHAKNNGRNQVSADESTV